MGFSAVTDNIKSTLDTDTTLKAWITSTFPGKTLKVIKAFHNRQEINVSDLPVVMITRPSRKGVDGPIGGLRRESSVLLYLGFYKESKDGAQDIQVAFEEQVEAALYKDRRRGGTAERTDYEESENDNGAYHPHYFTVMQFKILTG